MTYLKVKKDKKLMNEKYNKFREIYKDQLFTLKEFYQLRKTYFNLSMDDVTVVELPKNKVSNYWGTKKRYSIYELPLPF